MSSQFSAVLLLPEFWPLDIEALSSALLKRFPEVGSVQAVHPRADRPDAAVLIVDQATVTIEVTRAPLPAGEFAAPMSTLRAAGLDKAVEDHSAALVISASSTLEGLEGAEAYAVLIHLIAAAAASFIPCKAVYWPTGYCLSRVEDFMSRTQPLMMGRMPLLNWVSFATIVPRGYTPEQATGMVTFGLTPFVGRELELAPRPTTARDALQSLTQVAQQMLDQGIALSDGTRVADLDGVNDMIVRERDYWLRRNLSAFVIVAPDAIVDVSTLRPRAPAA